eukprot:maker-scaffold160_size295910-snap-gene-0.8 protein:Tk01226 transcript:maker-scaffold160_size295910-snap-gene-0.8-mRNA-1 annotation:"PREDICTED: uncharacterized protein LOC100161421"
MDFSLTSRSFASFLMDLVGSALILAARMIGHSSISLAVLLYLCVSTNNVQGSRSSSGQRDGKLLSLFQIVRFPNDPCIGNAGKNGTCYTNDECSTKGGSSGGSCAQGYGVCCTFTVNCGGQRSENCTYFESRGGEVGGCIATICPCSNNICQLRLDFDQFTITGPSTSMASIGTFKFGQPAAAGATYTTSSQCLTDSFSVGDPTGCAPPTICGINTNEHMYVDASEACNDLTFALGNQDLGTGIANRQWSIKVTQYSCDYKNLAPDGCTQYFFGPSTDSVQTYNFDGGRHLADQNQNICIRRERGNCRICYTAVLDADFAVNGIGDAAIGANTVSNSIGRTWGPIPKLSRWAYTGIVRTGLTYAAHLWAHHLKARHK